VSRENHDSVQRLHFLGELSNPEYDKNGELKRALQQWDSLIKEYEELKKVTIHNNIYTKIGVRTRMLARMWAM